MHNVYDFGRHQRTSIVMTYCDTGFCIVLFTPHTNLNVSLPLRISRLQSQVAWSRRRRVTFLERLLGDLFLPKYQGIRALLPNLLSTTAWNWFLKKLVKVHSTKALISDITSPNETQKCEKLHVSCLLVNNILIWSRKHVPKML